MIVDEFPPVTFENDKTVTRTRADSRANIDAQLNAPAPGMPGEPPPPAGVPRGPTTHQEFAEQQRAMEMFGA
jgi:hypothetical protein